MRRLSYVLVSTLCVWANDVRLYQLSFDVPNKRVSFKLRWSNAWRFAPDDPPGNWDAVWIFVKFRECNRYHDWWTHGRVSTNPTDHTIPQGLEIVRSNGSATGVDPEPNNTGLMVRPANVGQFPNIPESNVDSLFVIQLVNDNTQLDPNKTYDVRVVAIEMVFIPEGPYYLGTLQNVGNGSAYGHGNAFTTTSTSPYQPYYINNANNRGLYSLQNGGLSATVPGAAMGYQAFHVMKYEITQGQFADFLNTLPNWWASYYNPGNSGRASTITASGTYPNIYQAARPHRAQGFMTWNRLLTYLDWAALRPITEMEFEKICRGPAPVPQPPQFCDIYAWGDTVIVAGINLSGSEATAEEYFTNVGPNNQLANATYSNVTYIGGDGGQGPVRVGIHAAHPNASSRRDRGLSYYGVADMSGNLAELCIHFHMAAQKGFSRNNGDGVLATNSIERDWHGINYAFTNHGWGFNPNSGGGYWNLVRGGSYASSPAALRISHREFPFTNTEQNPWWGDFLALFHNSPQPWIGGRGARN